MENELKVQAEKLAQEMAAAKAEAAAAKAEVANMKASLEAKDKALEEAKSNIDNLDASVKEQRASIEELKVMVKASKNPTSFKQAFRQALEEKKAEIEGFMKKGDKDFTINLEVKSVVSIGTNTAITGNGIGLQADPTIHGVNPAGNVFIATIGLRPRTANKLSWLESTKQNMADYVAELAQNTNKSDVVVTEKQRQYGKIATYMTISTEVEDWFEQIYNYCVNEGMAMVEEKLDKEIFAGVGDDSTAPNKIYGLKNAATAFSALAAAAVENANIADVIMDARDQVAKAGYSANVVFITWACYRQLTELKTTTGDYLFDRVNGILNGLRIIPTDHMVGADILVADINVVEAYAGNGYELEFIRNGAYDAYDVYFRKAAQVKVPTAKKKGLVLVASAATAIAALLKPAEQATSEQ